MIVFEDFDKKIELVKTHPFFKCYLDLYKENFEEFSGKEIPPLNYSDFICYKETGSRHEFESKYFERRERLATSFILYLIYREEKYLDMLCNSLWAICGEISWVVPAHLPLKAVEKYRTHLDLFSCETAAYLAEVIYFVGDDLPEELKNFIIHEVTERALISYENNTFWWETLKSNWAAVCAGSIGMAYMMIAPERFEKVKARLLGTIESFLSGYGEDGCCIEGMSYWDYGFGYFINFADMLYKFSEGKDDLLHREKVKNIASYLQSVIMRKDILVSFSDSGRRFDGSNIGLYSYLHDTYGALVPTAGKEIYECRLSYAVRNFLWVNPEHYEENAPCENLSVKYYEDAQWYIKRNVKYSFAAKAGNNAEEHNHNDIGSFIFADDSGQILADLGCMEYTKANFDPKTRYTLLQNSSLGHSVPIIDGKGQSEGSEFFGTVIKKDEEGFVVELKDAYDVEIEKATRSFVLLENGIRVTDSFEISGGKNIKERFVSIVKPCIENGLIKIGNAVLNCKETPTVTMQELTSHSGGKIEVYLMDFDVKDSNFELEILI